MHIKRVWIRTDPAELRSRQTAAFKLRLPHLTGILALLGLILGSCSTDSKSPTLVLAGAAEIHQAVQKHKGRAAVLVNVWATWCAPCVKEFPVIVELADRYREAGLVTYFVSVDFPEAEERVKRFLMDHGVRSGAFMKQDTETDNDFIDRIYPEWSGAVPFTMVYGRSSGKIVAFWEGEAPREKFEQAILGALQL